MYASWTSSKVPFSSFPTITPHSIHLAAKKEPPPSRVDPRSPNSVCTVQVYQRVATSGLRGSVVQTAVMRGYCGADSKKLLQHDIYELVAAHSTTAHRKVYPATEDTALTPSLRRAFGFGVTETDRMCRECDTARNDCLKRANRAKVGASTLGSRNRNASSGGLLSSLVDVASGVGRALFSAVPDREVNLQEVVDLTDDDDTGTVGDYAGSNRQSHKQKSVRRRRGYKQPTCSCSYGQQC